MVNPPDQFELMDKDLEPFEKAFPDTDQLLEVSVPIRDIRQDPIGKHFPENVILPLSCEPDSYWQFFNAGMQWVVLGNNEQAKESIFSQFEVLSDLGVAKYHFAFHYLIKNAVPLTQEEILKVAKVYDKRLTRCLKDKNIKALLEIIRETAHSRDWFTKCLDLLRETGGWTIEYGLEISPKVFIKYATARYIDKVAWFDLIKPNLPDDLYFKSGSIFHKQGEVSRPEIVKKAYQGDVYPAESINFDFVRSKKWDKRVTEYNLKLGSLQGYLAKAEDYFLKSKADKKESSEPAKHWVPDPSEIIENLSAPQTDDKIEALSDTTREKLLSAMAIMMPNGSRKQVEETVYAIEQLSNEMEGRLTLKAIAKMLDKNPDTFRKQVGRMRESIKKTK
jgi:hypothetical protein